MWVDGWREVHSAIPDNPHVKRIDKEKQIPHPLKKRGFGITYVAGGVQDQVKIPSLPCHGVQARCVNLEVNTQKSKIASLEAKGAASAPATRRSFEKNAR